jgi:membrane dipeptidase
VCVTVGHVLGEADPYTRTLDDLERWASFLDAHADTFVRCTHAAQITAAAATGRIGVVLAFQNSLMFGDDATRVAAFAARGVRLMQLTYNDANRVGCGSLVQPDAGLSPFGQQVLQAIEAAGALPDLSHASDATLRGALDVVRGPLLVSHTGCRALASHRRNLADDELRAVADSGGLVGIYAMPFLREQGQPMRADWVQHIEHAWQVCGEDHVGIGTDGPLTAIDDVPAYMHFLAQDIAERRRLGVSAAGEDPEVALFLPDCRGPGQFVQLAQALADRGHGAARIDKLLGGNALRLLA